MKKIQTVFMLLVTMAWASCNNEQTDVNMDDNIRINTSINGMTRVLGTSFQNGDIICVYAYETETPANVVVNAVQNTFNGTTWTPASSMKWKDKTTLHSFFAVCPVMSIIPPTQAVNYTLSETDITQNDFLVALAPNLLATDGPVDLNFTHIMSRVSIILSFNDEFDTPPVVEKVVLKSKRNTSITFSTKAVVTNGTVSDMTLKREGTTSTYVNVTAPQTLAANDPMIEVYVVGDAVPYIYTPTAATILISGRDHQFKLKVGGGKKIELSGNINIGDWGTETPIDGGTINVTP